MTHPIMFAAARRLVAEENRRKAARLQMFRTWGPRSTTAASRFARSLLGDEAMALEWEPFGFPVGSDKQLKAAAPLGTLSGLQLELLYERDADGAEKLALRHSCTSCPSQQIEEITSLEQFGLLLSKTTVWKVIAPLDGGAAT